MRLLIISDTHDNYPLAFQAHTLVDPVDAIVHLGDGCRDVALLRQALPLPVIAVAGNCDHGSTDPRELIWEGASRRVLLTHGDLYRVKSGLSALRHQADRLGVQAVLFGHTHVALNEQMDEALFINPGSLAPVATSKTCALLEISEKGMISSLYDVERGELLSRLATHRP